MSKYNIDYCSLADFNRPPMLNMYKKMVNQNGTLDKRRLKKSIIGIVPPNHSGMNPYKTKLNRLVNQWKQGRM